MIVVDASLGVKWFLNETGSQVAIDILAAEFGTIAAPDLFSIEVAATLVREANAHKDSASEMRLAIRRLANLFDSFAVELFPTIPESLVAATSLALDLGHPLKDCLYLALAIELDCDLVTCDVRFAEKAKGVWDRVRVLGA
jgi:predicted nucleic acid-binding protein